MSYYLELRDGNRTPIEETTYTVLTVVHKYIHIIREANVTIIREK